jgi:hypothetical protein
MVIPTTEGKGYWTGPDLRLAKLRAGGEGWAGEHDLHWEA